MQEQLVISAAEAVGVDVRVLAQDERGELFFQLERNFNIKINSRPLWDSNDSPDGVFRRDGWRVIPMFVGMKMCLVFLPRMKTILEFIDGASLLRVLEECPAFEFYVCDKSASYLLWYNEHDFVIGWGAAKPWVDNLKFWSHDGRTSQ